PFAFNFTADGHMGRVMPAGDSWWTGGIGLPASDDASELTRQAGLVYPLDGAALVEIRLFERGLAKGVVGATASISGGARAIYQDAEGRPDPSLKATSSYGGVLFGYVAAGRVTVTVQAPGLTCITPDRLASWEQSGPNALALITAADSLTGSPAALFCYPP
ncbi:MAG TPA: hypothetical protein VN914_20655, partial [Polyangia bacterium]|nr:hypothetical protein [Polyangia bacterium]